MAIGEPCFKRGKSVSVLASAVTAIVMVLHGCFLVLEMFLWTKPMGMKVFRMSKAEAETSRVLAANQGFYNGMLALGLLATFFIPDRLVAESIRTYCLFFIFAVGCYGWYTVNFRIFLVQSLPALIALILGRF
jgi:putative membrane protein